jgi:hypothetical protein
MLQDQGADAMMRVAGRLAGAGALESIPSLAVAELDQLSGIKRAHTHPPGLFQARK